jgi:cell division protein FtsB
VGAVNIDVGTVIALISLTGVITTAYLGNKGKAAEVKAVGMNDLNDALQEELKRKTAEIQRLETENTNLRSEIRTLRAVLRGE